MLQGLQPVVAPAEAGHTEATERGGDIALAVSVDGHRAGPHPAGHPQRHVDVLGPDRRGQPVVGVVGQAQDFVALERWGTRLIAIAENPAFRDDHDIRLQEAKGAVNAISVYGEPRDFVALERLGARLIALAENPAFSDNPDIQLREAAGAINAILGYGRADPSFESKRHAWWLRLAKVAREFPGHAGIQDIASRCGLTFVAQAAKGWPYGAPSEQRRQKTHAETPA